MSDGQDATDPDAPTVNVPKGVVKGEVVPPDEHTLRVRARQQRESAATSLKVHDERDPADPVDPAESPPRSSTEMADSSRRQRKRERDRRAERRAMQLIVLLFLGVGGGAFAIFNTMIDDDPSPPPPPVDPSQQPQVVAPPSPPSGVISTRIDETPDIPAIAHLMDSGLTIAAEGIPQVDAVEGSGNNAALAALETCRFSYAVWEFSPNKRFRFMSTCGALEGQVMFGAYEIDGGVIRMSPLVTDSDAVTSEFHVERPSKMLSHVSRTRDEAPVLQIEQKVTAMRPGQDGDAWRDAFASKNTIHLPGERAKDGSPGAPQAPPLPPPVKQGKDPLLELLKN